MARRARGRPIHGWLNLDKPSGISSAQAVAAVRRATGAAKLGHAGTLDPFATGVLPIALGEATKTVPYVVEAAKAYRFTVRWGEARTTDDPEGEVAEMSDVRPDAQAIAAALPAFVGEIDQVPPAFSAVKVAGKRAYAMARAGEAVELAPRRVRIDTFELVEVADADHAVFTVACGRGAYVRSLARDLARELGTVGHLSRLRRTAVGRFHIEDAISLEKLQQVGHIAVAGPPLIPISTALDDIPALALRDDEADRLRQGQAVPVLRPADRARIEAVGDDGVVLAIAGDLPVALVRVDGIQIRPLRVLNL